MSSRRTGFAIVATIIVASAVAFAHAEQLKLERGIIGAAKITKHFSPVCMPSRLCRADHHALLRFRLRSPSRLAVTLIDDAGRTVRTLTPPGGKRYGRGVVRLHWNGRTDAGARAPDGRYRLRVQLLGQGRTITLPAPLFLDGTPPRLRLISAPGHVPVRYAVSEPALVFLAVHPLAGGKATVLRGRHGVVMVPRTLVAAPATLRLIALDLAGNASPVLDAGQTG
jgi:flagellar hook capping protein FlgD